MSALRALFPLSSTYLRTATPKPGWFLAAVASSTSSAPSILCRNLSNTRQWPARVILDKRFFWSSPLAQAKKSDTKSPAVLASPPKKVSTKTPASAGLSKDSQARPSTSSKLVGSAEAAKRKSSSPAASSHEVEPIPSVHQAVSRQTSSPAVDLRHLPPATRMRASSGTPPSAQLFSSTSASRTAINGDTAPEIDIVRRTVGPLHADNVEPDLERLSYLIKSIGQRINTIVQKWNSIPLAESENLVIEQVGIIDNHVEARRMVLTIEQVIYIKMEESLETARAAGKSFCNKRTGRINNRACSVMQTGLHEDGKILRLNANDDGLKTLAKSMVEQLKHCAQNNQGFPCIDLALDFFGLVVGGTFDEAALRKLAFELNVPSRKEQIARAHGRKAH